MNQVHTGELFVHSSRRTPYIHIPYRVHPKNSLDMAYHAAFLSHCKNHVVDITINCNYFHLDKLLGQGVINGSRLIITSTCMQLCHDWLVLDCSIL